MTAHHLRFAELSPKTMAALLAGELDTARIESGVELGELFVDDRAKWLWNYRLKQLETQPEAADWIARAVLSTPPGVQGEVVVGYAGFHGPPDADGMVEVGYTVDPQYRRRGYAKAILAALLDRAAAEPAVRVVRATISPDNEASLATIASFGFTQNGEQWDEEDGLELIFERPA
ncbi:RimJ/RimL family protein N-acetyltransferase [Kribbella voronezhensis]|uniref:RimJ/RimL family protein N-acetyltransferase n=1 Tax=Kribbella voronezhensis TaxID=2512212 RepID=A0A4R7TC92_9ACTN|nr:GNAT family N-acetyltransferase [Kribbella voronezhensis]TDU89701.1 RimJ/RimL family protein N-acetyltransferase [Kribbella voronezhensis]